MGKTFAEISQIIFNRRQARGPLLEQMMAVRERANGEWVLPDWNIPNVTSALVADSVDNLGLAAAEVTPNTYCPALDPEDPDSVDRAVARRKAYGYSLFRSEWPVHAYRAFRHMAAYATTALDVQPDYEQGCPVVKVRDPLHAFPEPKAPEDITPPADCGFVYGKSAEWIRANHPAARDKVPPSERSSIALWDMVEWVDADDVVLGVLGPRDQFTKGSEWDWGLQHGKAFEIRRDANKAGECTVVIPERVTLDRIISSVSLVLGIPDLLAKLLALDILGSEKSVIPDRYVIGTPGGVPTLIGGNWADGRTGKINKLSDVAAIGEMRGTPDPNNKTTMDRLVRDFRSTTGLIPQYGGENMHGVRTGRAMSELAGAAVDPRVRELHVVMQARMTHVNRLLAATYEGCFKTKKYTVFSGHPTDTGMVDFTPAEVFETRENVVAYPIPGADMQLTTIVLAQMRQTGMMSQHSAMHAHPWVNDPDGEIRRQAVEAIDQAIQAAVLSQSQVPGPEGLPIVYLTDIGDALAAGENWRAAVKTAQRKAQEQQAKEAEPPAEGQAVSPELMPGLQNPGGGTEAQPPQQAGGPPALEQVRALAAALGQPPGAAA